MVHREWTLSAILTHTNSTLSKLKASRDLWQTHLPWCVIHRQYFYASDFHNFLCSASGTLIYSSSPAMCPRVHVCVGATLTEHLHAPCCVCTTVWACTTAGTPPSIIGVLPQSGGGGGGGGGGMVDKEQIYQWIQDLSSSESYTREQALMELRWAEMGPSTPDVLQDTVTGIGMFVVI